MHAGDALCRDAATGKKMGRQRLDTPFTASLVLAGDHHFATCETGKTFIFKASPKAYEQVAENQLGNESLATPTCGSHIYTRVATTQAGRQELTRRVHSWPGAALTCG